MKILMMLMADYANIAEGGKINVMGIFRSINVRSFPARYPQMSIVAKLEGEFGEEGQEREITIILREDDGKEILRTTGNVTVPESKSGLRPEINLILNYRDIVFQKPGLYQFVLMADKDFKGDCSLEVVDISKSGE
jgi:hypothetical protein